MVHLRGITWDHIRGMAPLIATSKEFQTQHPGVSISWDKRSLEEFESYPVEILAEKYELILLDHPFMGSGVKKRVLLPLNEYLTKDFLDDQKLNSVGPSFDSYTWEGQQWALAVDAAAQVSAYRAVNEWGFIVPKTWDEVFELAKTLPDNMKIGFPLSPTHAFCSFLTLCANIGGHQFWSQSGEIDSEIGEAALNLLQRLVPVIHPVSLESNPIHFLNLMANTNEIAYAPLIFGYSNYAQSGFLKKMITFTDIPSYGTKPSGAVIGGVGLAISAKCKNIQAAVDYARYVASGECQKGVYFESGGQPGHRAAWIDDEVNRRSNNFFKNTLKTLDHSYVRPRYIGYIDFQKKGGEQIHQFLLHGGNSRELMNSLNRFWYKHLKRTKSTTSY